MCVADGQGQRAIQSSEQLHSEYSRSYAQFVFLGSYGCKKQAYNCILWPACYFLLSVLSLLIEIVLRVCADLRSGEGRRV